MLTKYYLISNRHTLPNTELEIIKTDNPAMYDGSLQLTLNALDSTSAVTLTKTNCNISIDSLILLTVPPKKLLTYFVYQSSSYTVKYFISYPMIYLYIDLFVELQMKQKANRP